MFLRAGLVYKGTRGSHHHFEDPHTGRKYTLAGNPSKELKKAVWKSAREFLESLGDEQ
jgi:predicted RNA binding protein YcfA (HicA-like mRNA interferase family)